MYCTNFILSQDTTVSAVRNKNIIDLISMHLSISPINIYIYTTPRIIKYLNRIKQLMHMLYAITNKLNYY